MDSVSPSFRPFKKAPTLTDSISSVDVEALGPQYHDFLRDERARLKNEYVGTDRFNEITNILISGIVTFRDSNGDLKTDYQKPRRLRHIKNYIAENMNNFASDDIPVIIALIHAVCAVKKHVWSWQPTSLANFIEFCSDNNFTCPTKAVLSGDRLLEVFKNEPDMEEVFDEVRRANGAVLGLK